MQFWAKRGQQERRHVSSIFFCPTVLGRARAFFVERINKPSVPRRPAWLLHNIYPNQFGEARGDEDRSREFQIAASVRQECALRPRLRCEIFMLLLQNMKPGLFVPQGWIWMGALLGVGCVRIT